MEFRATDKDAGSWVILGFWVMGMRCNPPWPVTSLFGQSCPQFRPVTFGMEGTSEFHKFEVTWAEIRATSVFRPEKVPPKNPLPIKTSHLSLSLAMLK